MVSMNSVMDLLSKKYGKMSKSQKKIANYINENIEKATFMTAKALGNACGISESTVVRFAFDLGYDGYGSMQDALVEIVKNRLNSFQRVDLTTTRLKDNNDILSSVINFDIANLKRTLENVDREQFDNAVKTILKADTIYIVGVRSSSMLAQFMYLYFNLMFKNVRLVSASGVGDIMEQIIKINSSDVIIGIGFPRYSQRTINSMKYSKDKGAKVISLTDSMKSPLALTSDINLISSGDMISLVDSLVAPLSLVNALVVALSLEMKDEMKESLMKLEEVWSEQKIYEK